MSIELTCPHCETPLTAPAATAGKTVRCPDCRGRVPVPVPDADDGEPEPEAEDERPAKGKRKTDPKHKRRGAVPTLLLVGVGTVLVTAAVVGGLAVAGAFSGPKPAPAAPATAEQPPPPPAPKIPAVPLGPVAAADGDPFHPTEHTAATAVVALDKMAEMLPAIPQDADRAKAVRAARLATAHATMDQAFDRVGRADAAWAEKARQALRLRAREMGARHEFGVPGAEDTASAAALAAAVAAGCDDPLVAYYHNLALDRAGSLSAERFLAEFRRITPLVWDSRYPDVRKLHAVNNLLALLRERGAPAAEVATWEGRFGEVLGRVCRDDDPAHQEQVIELARLREDSARLSGRTRERGYDDFAAVLAESGAPEYTRLVVKGGFLIRHGWDARGSGFGNTVTAEGSRLLRERLGAAEAALTAAFELDPDRPHAPTRMLTVCMGLGHSRAEVEEWFARAMRAEPDNVAACHAKLEYLHPKWYGTQNDHLGFAWQCVRTRNTTGLLPYAAVAHITANAPLPDPVTPAALAGVQAYYAHPTVWRVLDAALVTVRRDRPDLIWVRGQHARLACVAGRYDVALRELAAVGDDHRRGGFKSAADRDLYRAWAKLGRLPDER